MEGNFKAMWSKLSPSGHRPYEMVRIAVSEFLYSGHGHVMLEHTLPVIVLGNSQLILLPNEILSIFYSFMVILSF